jgi:hypothetical protein
LYRWIETMGRAPVVDPEVWHVPQAFFPVNDLPETLIALLKLIADDYVPEITATVNLYHEWLGSDGRASGTICDVEEVKRNHQVLGEFEHVQRGVTIKRIALLDCVNHHRRFQDVADQMSDGEKATLNGILQNVGAQDLGKLQLKRDMKRYDYAHVLD